MLTGWIAFAFWLGQFATAGIQWPRRPRLCDDSPRSPLPARISSALSRSHPFAPFQSTDAAGWPRAPAGDEHGTATRAASTVSASNATADRGNASAPRENAFAGRQNASSGPPNASASDRNASADRGGAPADAKDSAFHGLIGTAGPQDASVARFCAAAERDDRSSACGRWPAWNLNGQCGPATPEIAARTGAARLQTCVARVWSGEARGESGDARVENREARPRHGEAGARAEETVQDRGFVMYCCR